MVHLPIQPSTQPPQALDASAQLNQTIQDIGETVLATTQVAEDIAVKLSSLTQQVQLQQGQIQAQGQQILALSQAIELIAQNHDDSSQQLTQLLAQLQSLTMIMEQSRQGDT
jgi:chromosome segregation ATPase